MNELEIIRHSRIPGMTVFFNTVDYRTPHFHPEWELIWLLDNPMTVSGGGGSFRAEKGDLLLFQPSEPHELHKVEENCTFLCLQVSPELLRQHEKAIRQVDFLLFCTGWDKFWGQARYFEDFPCLTAEAAAFVASLPLKGVGEDSISLDPCDSVRFPNHMTLLGRNFLNTENLKDLDQLIGRPFTFVTLPLKFENADGCSCRAVAITEEE